MVVALWETLSKQSPFEHVSIDGREAFWLHSARSNAYSHPSLGVHNLFEPGLVLAPKPTHYKKP